MDSIRCYHNMVFGLLSLEPSGRVFGNTVGHEHGRLVDDFESGF